MTEERKIKTCTQILCVICGLETEEKLRVPRWFINSLLRYYDPELILSFEPMPITARECILSALYWEDQNPINRYWNGGRTDKKEAFPLFPKDASEWQELEKRWDGKLDTWNVWEELGSRIIKKAADDACLAGVFSLLVYLTGGYTKEEFLKDLPTKSVELIEDLLAFPRDED